jgi:hypothetical protein
MWCKMRGFLNWLLKSWRDLTPIVCIKFLSHFERREYLFVRSIPSLSFFIKYEVHDHEVHSKYITDTEEVPPSISWHGHWQITKLSLFLTRWSFYSEKYQRMGHWVPGYYLAKKNAFWWLSREVGRTRDPTTLKKDKRDYSNNNAVLSQECRYLFSLYVLKFGNVIQLRGL